MDDNDNLGLVFYPSVYINNGGKMWEWPDGEIGPTGMFGARWLE
jgi:hypothetical protein